MSGWSVQVAQERIEDAGNAGKGASDMNANSTTAVNMQSIATQLREQESALATEHRALDVRLRQVGREIRSVRAALAALGFKNERSSESATNGKSALTTDEVFALVKDVLTQDGPTEPASLRMKIEQRAKESGRLLTGFHLRFAKALKDPRLSVVDGACHLSGDTGKSPSTRDKT